MKLFHSTSSPFVRKVLVTAIERGLRDRLELVPVQVGPIMGPTVVHAHNPAGKIPTLLLDDGEAVYDSRVIVEHLDGLPGGAHVLPLDPVERRRARVLESLADEMTDAAVLLRYELAWRPEALRWPAWIDGQRLKLTTSLDELERRAGELEGAVHVGGIATGCALGYLDLRFGDLDWRAGHPRLAAWYETFAARPSMQATLPS